MTQEELKNFIIENGYEDAIVFEDYDYAEACIGISNDGRAVYSYDKMIMYLMEKEGWSMEESMEWIDYNTLGSLPSEGKYPIVVYDFPE